MHKPGACSFTQWHRLIVPKSSHFSFANLNLYAVRLPGELKASMGFVYRNTCVPLSTTDGCFISLYQLRRPWQRLTRNIWQTAGKVLDPFAWHWHDGWSRPRLHTWRPIAGKASRRFDRQQTYMTKITMNENPERDEVCHDQTNDQSAQSKAWPSIDHESREIDYAAR